MCVCINSTQTAIRLETEGNPPTITETRMEVRLAAKHCQLTVYLLIIYSLCLYYQRKIKQAILCLRCKLLH